MSARTASLLALAAGFQPALAPAYGSQTPWTGATVPSAQGWVALPQAAGAPPVRQEPGLTVWGVPALVAVAVAAARLGSGSTRPVAAASVGGVAAPLPRRRILSREALRPIVAPRSAAPAMKVDMPGECPPLGFFDPLGFSKDASPETMKKYREAELKHGRVAMIASFGMIVADKWHPLFDGKNSSNPLLALTQTPKLGWLQILTFIMFIEVLGIINSRRPDYQPGDFLGSSQYETDESWKSYQTKELNNGRLAMFGSIGMLVGSYITGKGPLEVMGGGDTIVF